jgi:hypothetical protein
MRGRLSNVTFKEELSAHMSLPIQIGFAARDQRVRYTAVVKPSRLLPLGVFAVFAGCNAIWGISERTGLGPDGGISNVPDVATLQDASMASDVVEPADSARPDAASMVDARPDVTDATPMTDAQPDAPLPFCATQGAVSLCDDFERTTPLMGSWTSRENSVSALSIQPGLGFQGAGLVSSWTGPGDMPYDKLRFDLSGVAKSFALEFSLYVETRADQDIIQLGDLQTAPGPHIMELLLVRGALSLTAKPAPGSTMLSKTDPTPINTGVWTRLKLEVAFDAATPELVLFKDGVRQLALELGPGYGGDGSDAGMARATLGLYVPQAALTSPSVNRFDNVVIRYVKQP